jgi:hypothetical protein
MASTERYVIQKKKKKKKKKRMAGFLSPRTLRTWAEGPQ